MKRYKGLIVSLSVFALLLALFTASLMGFDAKSSEERRGAAENAIRRALVTCYAIESRYPSSLTYLYENYGLRIDEEKYYVRYEAFASNVMPVVEVYARRDAA